VPVYELPLDELVCDVIDDCPDACHCQRRPASNSLVVECRDVAMTSLPDVMPFVDAEVEEGLVVKLVNSTLRILEARDYLRQTKELYLRNSGLQEVAREAGPLMKGVARLDMGDNLLRTLPDTLRVMSPDAVLLDGNPLQ
jgi:hypothetical protein